MDNNFLKIELDLLTMKESFIFDNSLAVNAVLISVTKNISLQTFSFNAKIYNESGQLLRSIKFPQEGIKLLKTNLDEIYSFQQYFLPDKKYKLDIEYYYLEEIKHATCSFVNGKPPKPFNSWIWNVTKWEAPIPIPSDAGSILEGKLYEWDEDTQTWTILGGYEVE